MNLFSGILLVALSGLGLGTSAWAMKTVRDIRLDQFLFINIIAGIIIIPWSVFLINVPHPLLVIQHTGLKPLLFSNLLSVGWGIANILFMLCILRIGAGLSGAILSAFGMASGVIIPFIFKGSGQFSKSPALFSVSGLIALAGIVVITIGIVLTARAGFEREKRLNTISSQLQSVQHSGTFLGGLIMVIMAGILSAGLSLAFVYSQGPVIAQVKNQGAGEFVANMSVWALCMMGGAATCMLYAVFRMTKQKTWNLIFKRKQELICGILIGFQFVVSIMLLGKGMVFLGILGASIGYGIQQSMQLIGNQIIGFAFGEWNGVRGVPRNTMYTAILVILLAVIIFSFGNVVR